MFQADCDLEDISNFHHISTLLDFRLAALAILISRVELVGHLVWMMPQNWFIMAPISASIVTGCSRLLHFSIPVARQHQINKINNKLHLHFAPTGPNWPQLVPTFCAAPPAGPGIEEGAGALRGWDTGRLRPEVCTVCTVQFQGHLTDLRSIMPWAFSMSFVCGSTATWSQGVVSWKEEKSWTWW